MKLRGFSYNVYDAGFFVLEVCLDRSAIDIELIYYLLELFKLIGFLLK